jgi:hypothetical protein
VIGANMPLTTSSHTPNFTDQVLGSFSYSDKIPTRNSTPKKVGTTMFEYFDSSVMTLFVRKERVLSIFYGLDIFRSLTKDEIRQNNIARKKISKFESKVY